MRKIFLLIAFLPLCSLAQVKKPTTTQKKKAPEKADIVYGDDDKDKPFVYSDEYFKNDNSLKVRLYFVDTNKVEEEKTRILKQEYSIDTATKKLDGYFKDFYKNRQNKSRGYYKQGYRVGVWEFYSPDGILMERYNYDLQRSFIYNENQFIPKRVYAAMGAKTSHLDTLDVIPHFVGGMNELDFFIERYMRQPYFGWLNGIKGTIIVSFVVGKDGLLREPVFHKKLGYGCEGEVLRVLNLMPRWAPAIKNQLPTETVFYLPIEIDCTK